MKTAKTYLLTAVAMLVAFISVQAQSDSTIKIKTSAQCEQCKKRIENSLSFEKGVKSAVLDVKSSELTVRFNPKKTNPEKIKTAITKTGYDADEMKAEKKAYDKLPDCCKKDGPEK